SAPIRLPATSRRATGQQISRRNSQARDGLAMNAPRLTAGATVCAPNSRPTSGIINITAPPAVTVPTNQAAAAARKSTASTGSALFHERLRALCDTLCQWHRRQQCLGVGMPRLPPQLFGRPFLHDFSL